MNLFVCVWKHRAERSHGILKKANLDFLTLLVLLSSVNRFQEFQLSWSIAILPRQSLQGFKEKVPSESLFPFNFFDHFMHI